MTAAFDHLLTAHVRGYEVIHRLQADAVVTTNNVSVSVYELDRLLGCVLSYSDDSFDTLLEIGFAESIRREWRWRASRGESLANLQAFARFADPARGGDQAR